METSPLSEPVNTAGGVTSVNQEVNWLTLVT